ncbi:hypothetical protein C8R42DRAFT_667798 [Lentinula raphanica]|nr:hypothetical protein C8R42DRAFT_667798 [Lentinula raphanica]
MLTSICLWLCLAVSRTNDISISARAPHLVSAIQVPFFSKTQGRVANVFIPKCCVPQIEIGGELYSTAGTA